MTLRDPLPDHTTIAVLGLGVTGRGAAHLLSLLGKRVIATDSRSELVGLDLPESVDVRLGGIDIGDATAAVLSPSLNPEWPENQEKDELSSLWDRWRRGEVEVVSEIVMASHAYPGAILSIGGTDGKSTTAALSAHLLKETGHSALLGGNSWTPFSQVLVDRADDLPTLAVVEVSAFQLWEPHTFEPNVALLTNIAPDHLDHFANEGDYVAAKKQVARNLSSGASVVLYSADHRLADWTTELAERGLRCHGYGVSPGLPGAWASQTLADRTQVAFGHLDEVIDTAAFGLPGEHNRKNLAGSLLATSLLAELDWSKLDPTALSSALRSFRGLPHRIELVRERGGVRFYNDSKATNVHAALAGLGAFEEPIVAIVGGVDKRLDLGPLIDLLEAKASEVIVIGELQSRLASECGDRLNLRNAASMDAAVQLAAKLTKPGESVVLSPACSSFDMFRSFEHRGDVFAAAVRALP